MLEKSAYDTWLNILTLKYVRSLCYLSRILRVIKPKIILWDIAEMRHSRKTMSINLNGTHNFDNTDVNARTSYMLIK